LYGWVYSISCPFVSTMPFILLFQKEPIQRKRGLYEVYRIVLE